VRCTSCACRRGSSVPTASRPRSIARPTTPYASARLIICGNNVTTSMRIWPHLLLFELDRPVDHDQPCLEIHPVQMPRRGQHPVLPPCSIFHNHQRRSRRLHEMGYCSEQRPFEIANWEPHQVRLVVLPLAGRRQLRPAHFDHRTTQSGGSIAVFHCFQPCDESLTVEP